MSLCKDKQSDLDIIKEVYLLEGESFECDPDANIKKQDVVYACIDGRDLIGTLYLPAAKRPKQIPSVVYIHGGGWSRGTREHFSRQAIAMAKKGFAGLCIDYRLSEESQYPAAIQDSKCAVRYLRANSDLFGLDASKIAAVGGSAGAHLAACLAVTRAEQKTDWEGTGGHQEFDSCIQAAVLFNGEFDLPSWWRYGKCNDFMLKFLRKAYEEAPALYEEASPINYLDANICPCLLLHGEEDVAVSVSQSIDFHNKILSVGGKSDLVKVPNVGHAWFNNEIHFESCLKKMMDFLLVNLQS